MELPTIMQNSTTRALRAIILLACLIVIPLVALFGTALPELAARFLEGGLGGEAAPAGESLAEAPRFCSEGQPAVSAVGPQGADVGEVVPAHGGPASGREVPAGYNLSVDQAARPSSGAENLGVAGPVAVNPVSASPVMAAPGMCVSDSPSVGAAVSPMSGSPLSGNSPVPLDANRTEPSVVTNAGSPPSSAEGGSFVRIQNRLRDLGAVYYKLESWGSQQQLFRFQCEMAVGSGPGLTRHFEAVDNDPLMAMHKALVEAEAWHASR